MFNQVIECMVLYRNSVNARHAELVKRAAQLRETIDQNEENDIYDHEIERRYWELENAADSLSSEEWEITKVLNAFRVAQNRNLTPADSHEIVRVFTNHIG